MCRISVVVEVEEARPIVGTVHIADAGVEHPSHAVEAERAEAPWAVAVAVAFAVRHIVDAEDAEVP